MVILFKKPNGHYDVKSIWIIGDSDFMKNKICLYTIVAMTILSLVGCKSSIKNNNKADINGDNNTDSSAEEIIVNSITEESAEENTISSNTEDSSISEYEAYEKYREYISPKSKTEIQLDDESEKLYSDFMEGNVAAEYSQDGDTTGLFDLSGALEEGKNYTLYEIIDKVNDGLSDSYEWYYDNCISEKYIDLGLDGSYELKTDIGAAEFTLTLIVKNVDNKLKICFAGESVGHSYTDVMYTGEVYMYSYSDYDSESAEHGYIDKDGNYIFWYYYSIDGYNIHSDEDLVYNDCYIGSGIGMIKQEYFIDKALSDSYCNIRIKDIDNNYLAENDINAKDAYNSMTKILKEEGKLVVTEEEIKKVLEEQRVAIGFSDVLYHYGDELKPKEN